ncbi:monooxygenase [Egibacter rhizosphaerae]|uniref:Monooxygenase n=1 Tax=Egibacter rhizosphaerae TaxID=1670831 RepID=A0A411YIP5_9ACTN|nr:monooxygenase [Egibacter rhizosphaerae]QBI21021.1 monooxygenase [Egibacter rhizosphaerae]
MSLTVFELFRVPSARVAAALARMARDRTRLRRTPGLLFWKLLGTGDGRTFDVRDADPRTWALLTVWADEAPARAFREHSPVAAGWRRLADEAWRAELEPVAARGRWSGHEPFGAPAPRRVEGPVAAITRARLAPRRMRVFWRAVPPVTAALHAEPGLRLAVGIGEAPVGLQGTFSLWTSDTALRRFAYQEPAHASVVAETPRIGWYREELFARFRVRTTAGTAFGRDPLDDAPASG